MYLVKLKSLKFLLGLSYNGNQSEHALKLLSGLYGHPHIIVDSQLKLVQNFPGLRIQDSHQISNIVITFVCILTIVEKGDDLKSTSKKNMILSKFQPDLKGKWTFFSIERKCSQSNMVELGE